MQDLQGFLERRREIPWPLAAQGYRGERDSRKAGAQRYLAMTFTCSPSLTEGFVFVQ